MPWTAQQSGGESRKEEASGWFFSLGSVLRVPFSALTLLVRRQEGIGLQKHASLITKVSFREQKEEGNRVETGCSRFTCRQTAARQEVHGAKNAVKNGQIMSRGRNRATRCWTECWQNGLSEWVWCPCRQVIGQRSFQSSDSRYPNQSISLFVN